MGNLGFISPIKEKVVRRSGYFLRSCSKIVGDFHLESRDVLGSGNSGLCSDGLSPLKVIDQTNDFGALRAVLAPVRVSL